MVVFWQKPLFHQVLIELNITTQGCSMPITYQWRCAAHMDRPASSGRRSCLPALTSAQLGGTSFPSRGPRPTHGTRETAVGPCPSKEGIWVRCKGFYTYGSQLALWNIKLTDLDGPWGNHLAKSRTSGTFWRTEFYSSMAFFDFQQKKLRYYIIVWYPLSPPFILINLKLFFVHQLKEFAWSTFIVCYTW